MRNRKFVQFIYGKNTLKKVSVLSMLVKNLLTMS